jgi:N-acetylglucosaminyldiphosphoundecaprenol N-acetyl-beta-D-mannosaminyltransferase
MNNKVKINNSNLASQEILDIRFDTVDKPSIAKFLRSEDQHTIYTPNAEMLVLASRDRHFKEVLNRSSMNICDGSGPAYLARLFEQKKVVRMTGTDFLLDVLAVAETEQKSVFLLGSDNAEVIRKCEATFAMKFPALKIIGTHPGIKLDLAEVGDIHSLVYDDTEMELLHDQIVMAAPDILIVAFGHPKQELFIDAFLEEFPSVRLAMGVGGALDFYAGTVRRAPLLMRRLGLESLWRLVLQPWRWRRVFTALVIFPILYVRHVTLGTNHETNIS